MKKIFLCFITLLSSTTTSFCAEKPIPTPSLKSWVPQPFKGLYTSLKDRLLHFTGKPGQALATTDVDDAVVVSFVTSDEIAKLHANLATVEKEVAQFEQRLATTTAQPAHDNTSLNEAVERMKINASKKDALIAQLQQQIDSLKGQVTTSEKKLEDARHYEEEDMSRVVKDYQAVLRENAVLQEQLKDITTKYSALAGKFKENVADLTKVSYSNQELRERYESLRQVMTQQDNELERILATKDEEMGAALVSSQVAQEQNAYLIALLTDLLQNMAQSQGSEYSPDFVRGLFDAALSPRVSNTTKESVTSILFPIEAHGDVFEY